MSGVVGVVDFERDLERHRPLLIALTATMANRGPDGEGFWLSPRAVLGHRALGGGAGAADQPFAIDVGGATVVACVTGAPTGLGEVARQLRAGRCGVTPGASTAELVARAYLMWGEDVVRRLGGAFALAIWDGRSEELVLARDRMGGQTLYHAPTRTGLVFASERKALLAHPEVDPVVDMEGLREVIAHALPPGPLFSGFGQVDSAEVVRYGRSGWRRHRYWELESRTHTDDVDATVARVRELLEENVRLSVPEDTDGLVATLSGGIDSSSVTALVAAELRRRGAADLRTFTVGFTDGEFQRDAVRDTQDAPFARAVAEHVGSRHRLVELDARRILDPDVRLGLMRAKDCPTRIYDMDASQYLFLQHVAAAGGRIAFTGGMGDQLFHGARWSTDPQLVDSGTFPWIALAQRHGAENGFGTRLLNHDTLRKLDLPSYYRDAYAESVAEVEFLPEDDEPQRRIRQLSHLLLTRFRTDAGLYNSVGLQMRAPINSVELVEYAYNIPAEMQRHGGIEKGLLRAAVADTLPEKVVRRPQSATPVSRNPAYARRLQEEFTAILADPASPVLPLIDIQAAARLAESPDELVRNRLSRADIDLVLQLNLWLDHYRVRLAL
ncbi:asparagine synthetase B [Nocardiopsis sp. CNR-923]|uniref:asparagine synthetase B family protein n=1 Tax=Nocardiopsis sp. CNR-923 TaxID=1904965 RepID=UPI0009608241|nr:asparagine synthase-related protein [Nocardiopsis sp. CNR-923]OLT24289.1 asparagine synthetase B [Nocardiopsis sp. CNR-923]